MTASVLAAPLAQEEEPVEFQGIAIYHLHNMFQVCAMRNLVRVFPGQVQHMFIVTSAWDNSWHLSLAGISFLSTQLVITFNCQSHTYLLNYLLTYSLTPWSRVLLEKLTVSQLVKKFTAF